MTIFEAIHYGNNEDLQAAISSGESVNQRDSRGFTPLRSACAAPPLEIDKVTLLLRAGADPNVADNIGCTPIAWAVTIGDSELISVLRKFGASLNCISDCGSLIADAVLGRQLQLIPWLISEGLDVNLMSPDGFTPLMLAAGNGVADAIPILLAHGAKVDLRDANHGLTAYLHAAIVGNAAAARFLLAAGADPKAVTDDGESAVCLALQNGHSWADS